MSYRAAVQSINSADLKASEKLFALAMLSAIDPATGSAALPWDTLTETISRKTLRNRLATLNASGILDYKTGSDVTVWFPSWGDFIPPTRDKIPPTRDNQSSDQSPQDGKSPPHGIKSPQGGIKSPQDGINGDHVCLLDTSSTSTTPEGDKQTNKQTTPNPAELKANLALLASININGFNRTAIANRYTFPDLMAHVMAYRAELSLGKVDGPGAFVTRCLNYFGVDPITGAAPVDELYNQHVTPQALATYAAGMPAPGTTAWSTLSTESTPSTTPAPTQKEPESVTAPRPIEPINPSTNQPTHPEGQTVWEQALDLLRPAFSASSFQHLTAATVTDYQNGNGVHLTLTAPPESLDFLQSQGRALIRRALGQVKRTGLVDLIIKSAP